MSRPLHISNARIWTADASRPHASSIRLADGKIAGLDVVPEATDEAIDAEGRTLIPGMIDAHLHLLVGGEALRQVDLSDVTTRGMFEAAIATQHDQLPADEWLIAGRWSDANLSVEGPPDHTWLRQAGNRPAIAYRSDLHAVLVNEAVMAMLDLTADPPGGHIVRDPGNGNPTGLLLEAAAWHMLNPLVPKATPEAKRHALTAAQAHCHQLGLTTVGSMEYQRDVEQVYAPSRDALTLRCIITLLDRTWPLDTTFGETFDNDDHLAVIGYKAFVDGTLGSRTARMFEPYADDPGNRGLLVELARDGQLNAWAERVADAGLSPSIHAIGDEAVHLALNAVAHLPAQCRARIEHAQQIAEDDIKRFAGIVASMQPVHKADDGRIAEARLGRNRLPGCFAFRSLINAGARLAFGSDWPVVACDPLQGVRAAVTGLTWAGKPFLTEQNLTVEESLLAYTSGAAEALGQSRIGRLAVGNEADIVMLDRDPFACDWSRDMPSVVLTVAGGRIVWESQVRSSHATL